MYLNGKIFIFYTAMLFCLVGQQQGIAQCTTLINSFPYTEDFEAVNNGNWTSLPSGEWQCGTPTSSKRVIQTAGGGNKSWIVGGLSGSSYSSGNSELRSPCFDFSSLANPEIIFKVFWETEKRFDGATFQYSLNEGNSWTTLGTVNSNANCDAVNWFTYDQISPYLGGAPGWSGNIQTGGGGGGNCLYGLGSGRWVTAKHTMNMLAGLPSVVFRFYFGAGTQCNDFDGFAVDDIYIGETPPPGIADFSFTCSNAGINFTNQSAACSVLWDFGDPISAQQNNSTDLNPSHVFSVGGVYTVTLTAFFASGASDVKTVDIGLLSASPQVLSQNKCFGERNNSFALQNLAGGDNDYVYSWNTNPVQNTATIANLPGGSYTVTLSSPGAPCPITVDFNYPDPPLLEASASVSPAKCLSNNGRITTNISGGKSPYNYSWNTNPLQQTSTATGLAPGLYSLTVTDDLGCVKQVTGLEILNVTVPLNISLGNTTNICPGQQLLLTPGTFSTYTWQDNSTSSTFSVTKTGTYSVSVSDADGCTGSASINVIVDCKGIYFPSAFTPGSDQLNPSFGAIGDIGSLKNYSLVIYNRYAQVIFATSDASKKWDGTFKGKAVDTQSFVWIVRYTLAGQKSIFKKGTVLLLR